MIIYAKYDEDDKYATAIYIPHTSGIDIKKNQEEFFKWLFDKSNAHKYWRIVDGQKEYCEYGIEAFVTWLNDELFSNANVKAKVLLKSTDEYDSNSLILYF